ncbi:glycoside hydrolase family 104 protein [Acinetobacter sp. YH12238]|uniref:glycoside hydrolase family 24 protein n=1 Tax=Acinetobacter sp. YH12238 TaxID=2601165 RepID=UPI0015D31538|nr:glycoside hydrolase family 104 protein [Acinetobacter sp. YH12238]
MATRQELEKALNNPNVRKILDVIASSEGVKHGYNTIFGNERTEDLKAHPNIKKEFTQTDGKKNSTTAAGRYQFLKGTWDSVSKKYGLKDFSPKNQDLAAVALILGRGALGDVIKGDFTKAIGKLGGEWASLPSSNYAQPKKSWKDIQNMVGEIKPPNRKPAQNRINQLVTAYDKQTKANTSKNKVNPQQRKNRVDSLLAAYDKQKHEQQVQQGGLPDFDENGVIREDQPPQPKPQQAPLSTMDKLIGGAEAGLTLATGAVGGAIGQAAGGLHGIAESVVDGTFGTQQGAQNAVNRATQLSNNLTYEPRTAGGQRAVGAVGEFIEDTGLDTLPPVLGGGVGASAATLGRASVPVATTAAREVAQAAKPVVAQVVEQAKRPVAAVTEAAKNTFSRNNDTGPAPANIGAAQVDQATVRQALAADLPVKPELTQGQISRDPGQLKFEVETAKNEEMGAPLRQRYEQQHQAVQQSIDVFIDQTGAEKGSAREAGLLVDDALQKQMQADKNRVRVAYKKADDSEEATTPVDITNPVSVLDDGDLSVIDYLNSQPELPTTPIITAAKRTAEALGIAQRGEDGQLVPGNPTIKQLEKWRSEINGNVNQEAPNIRQATILKNFIDAHIEPHAGSLYKAARIERKRFADKWENHTIVKDLVETKKGTDDRKVAFENVVDRVVYRGSLDDLRQAKRTIMTAGPEGQQAWREIQASVLRDIKDQATQGVAPDAQGNQMISPAKLNAQIRKLDDKLDFIFGKQGADKLRALNEVSKTIFTVPTSAAINHSNTAATLSAAMDLVLSGMSGFPAPVASALRLSTKHIKDRKIRKRVEDALNPRS